ncbi:hypothetical protein NU08_4509 [Flavobacterium anhuiense]|uniref:Lipoprotein n=1 Tax=Flavobacterium anhuiense TaxID=459526 RepID=A0A444VSJ9_9FLAO|nr:hypothetical protein [Flavobacterium anhuiense]RYJ36443.1 hypothetical protein NU08_4509 [Flavobacterium anhuiense]
MKKILFILISLLAVSCSNDDKTPETDKTSINLVTGINVRNTADDTGLYLGNPNTLANQKFVLYPNPANETVYILAEQNVTNVWIVPATAEKIYQDFNFSSILNNNLYSEQSIISNSNLSLNGLSTNNPKLNISTLAKGYYKVFIKSGGVIYWDNLYKYESNGNNEEQFNTIKNFWK